MLTPFLPRQPGLRWATLLTLTTASLAMTGCGSLDTEAIAAKACTMITDTGSVVVGSGQPGDPAAPEPASGFRLGKTAVTARNVLVATANPLASKAGCDVLKQGGSAVDAAVAVQMVLGLVEPQSSGLGGGAFMLHYDAASGSVVAYDGRETAPAAATENYLRWVSDTDRTLPQPGGARASGRSIGTPGAVRMLELAHQAHGRQPWSQLFDPAITLATDGFQISGRMAQAIDGATTGLKRDPEATAYFFNTDGTPKALGTLLKNPAYAATLNTLARGGANAFYTGPVAQGIVDKIKVTSGGNPAVAITPGLTEMSDLAGYQAKARIPVCTTYRDYEICGMPPPSSGGITVAQIMGIVENFDMAAYKPTDIDIYGGKPTVMGVHLMAEAGRLAYADRNKYIADTDFHALPGNSWATLLDKTYLHSRAKLIQQASMGTASAGVLGTSPAPASVDEGGTTHLTIVDRRGNVVSMTTTVEWGMGSFRLTKGFLLNNQLTDFSMRAERRKRQRSPTGWKRTNVRAVRWRRRWCSARAAMATRRLRHGYGLAGWCHHHPVRREDPGGRSGLGAGRAAGHVAGELRCSQQRHHQRRRRAPQHQHRQQRQRRPAGQRAARTAAHGVDQRAIQRRQHHHAGAGQRQRRVGKAALTRGARALCSETPSRPEAHRSAPRRQRGAVGALGPGQACRTTIDADTADRTHPWTFPSATTSAPFAQASAPWCASSTTNTG